MSFKCPCGCALQLTPEDQANEARLIAILGPTPRHADLRVAADARVHRKDPPEPMKNGVCRNCGAVMRLEVFLVDFLALRGAPWPHCEDCAKGRQRELWEAA